MSGKKFDGVIYWNLNLNDVVNDYIIGNNTHRPFQWKRIWNH